MWTSTMLILLIASLTGIIRADDEAQWPPEPAMIFPQNVIWSEVESSRFAPYATLTIEQMLQVHFWDGRVEQYDLPEAMRIDRVELRPDDNVLVFAAGAQEHNPDDVLLLNTDTGLYERLPMVCESRVLRSQPDSTGEWVLVYRDEALMDGILCQSRTGEMRNGVPSRLHHPPGFNRQAYPDVTSSPDGESLVVVGVTDETGSQQVVVYAYDLALDTWTRLGDAGDVPLADAVVNCGWVSDTHGLICASFTISGRSTSTNYYRFDLTAPDTLELAFAGWGPETVFDNPGRYIAIRSDNDSVLRGAGRSAEAAPCTVTFYDARFYYQDEAGYECIPSFTDSYNRALLHRQGDALYFLITDSPDATTSTLQQINLTRPDPYVHPLLTAEIEAILSITPDVRHVVVLMDDNGRLDFPYESEICCSGRDHWLVTIISAEDGQIIYQSPPVAVFKADQVGWLDEQTLVFITTDSVIHRVTLHDRGVDVATTSRYAIDRQALRESLINQRYWLVSEPYAVLDLLTFERLPVVNPEALALYDVSMHPFDDDAIQITITSRDGAGSAVYAVSFAE